HELLIACSVRHCHLRIRLAQLARDATNGQCLAVAENHRALYDFVQLADVAWIGVPLQQDLRVRLDVQDLFAELLAEPDDRAQTQGDDVFDARSQRGELEGHNIEAKEEVFGVRAGRDLYLRVPGDARQRR